MSFRSFSSIATRCISSFSLLVNVIIFSSFSLVSVLLKREKNVKVLKYCLFVFIISVYSSESTLLIDNCAMEVIMTNKSAMLIMLRVNIDDPTENNKANKIHVLHHFQCRHWYPAAQYLIIIL